MGAANGGQIVCSSATVALCRDSAFRDAGHHVSAGVGDEQLFVVVGVGSSEDRPLRTVSSVPTNIVQSMSRFVGRDDELRRSRLDRNVPAGHAARTGRGRQDPPR